MIAIAASPSGGCGTAVISLRTGCLRTQPIRLMTDMPVGQWVGHRRMPLLIRIDLGASAQDERTATIKTGQAIA